MTDRELMVKIFEMLEVSLKRQDWIKEKLEQIEAMIKAEYHPTKSDDPDADDIIAQTEVSLAID